MFRANSFDALLKFSVTTRAMVGLSLYFSLGDVTCFAAKAPGGT